MKKLRNVVVAFSVLFTVIAGIVGVVVYITNNLSDLEMSFD